MDTQASRSAAHADEREGMKSEFALLPNDLKTYSTKKESAERRLLRLECRPSFLLHPQL